MSKLFVISNIHGNFEKLINLLYAKSLINSDLRWTGADATLCVLGDMCDMGLAGIDCIDLIIRLQIEAATVAGKVVALLGEHELMLLAAYRFGHTLPAGMEITFYNLWKQSGGQDADLAGLTETHVAWLSKLPIMAHAGGYLLVHSDTDTYSELGDSVESVNRAVTSILHTDFACLWLDIFNVLCDRGAFMGQREMGVKAAYDFLTQFSGFQVVHGHTAIHLVTQSSELYYEKPFVYAANYCINIDAGMQMKRPGILWELPELLTIELPEPAIAIQLPSPVKLEFSKYAFA